LLLIVKILLDRRFTHVGRYLIVDRNHLTRKQLNKHLMMIDRWLAKCVLWKVRLVDRERNVYLTGSSKIVKCFTLRVVELPFGL